METRINKSIYYIRFVKTALLGLVLLGGAASPLLSQETVVAGKFTLNESTGFGNKFLPAGAYKFSIEPTGILQSVNSIQGARRLVQVIVRSETKAGPVAVIFAMASRTARTLDSSRLVLAPVNNGMVVHSMYLDQPGLVLDFDWSSPKGKTQMLAEAPGPEPASASRAND
jgi:hypothetical protein